MGSVFNLQRFEVQLIEFQLEQESVSNPVDYHLLFVLQ